MAYGFASLLLLLFAYSKLFYTNFYPENELVESAVRYIIAAIVLGAWLLSWYRFSAWWKKRLISKTLSSGAY